MRPIIGLDVSGDRIAWAVISSHGVVVRSGIGVCCRGAREHTVFVAGAVAKIEALTPKEGLEFYALEINLHPKLTYKGRPAANMIRSYMVSRWTEGRLLHALGLPDPVPLERVKGAFYKLAGDWSKVNCISLQASGGKDAKKRRREKLKLLYALDGLAEDEWDALYVAYEVDKARRCPV